MSKTTLLRSLPAWLAAGLMLLCGCAGLAQSAPTSSTDRMEAGVDKKLDSPFAAFRLGVAATPVLGIDTGLDVTFPRLRIGPAWTTRADLDLSAHFRSRSFASRRDAVV